MINITGSINDITSNITGSISIKNVTIPFLSPNQVNQNTINDIKNKEILKLSSNLILNIIK